MVLIGILATVNINGFPDRIIMNGQSLTFNTRHGFNNTTNTIPGIASVDLPLDIPIEIETFYSNLDGSSNKFWMFNIDKLGEFGQSLTDIQNSYWDRLNKRPSNLNLDNNIGTFSSKPLEGRQLWLYPEDFTHEKFDELQELVKQMFPRQIVCSFRSGECLARVTPEQKKEVDAVFDLRTRFSTNRAEIPIFQTITISSTEYNNQKPVFPLPEEPTPEPDPIPDPTPEPEPDEPQEEPTQEEGGIGTGTLLGIAGVVIGILKLR